MAQNSFQHFPRHTFWWVIITTLYQLMLQSWYQKTVQSFLNSWCYFRDTIGYLKAPLISALRAYISKTAWWNLNFRTFKVALNPMYGICLNFAKSCISSCLSKYLVRKNFTVPFLKYKHLKLKLRVFLAGYSVAMVTYCVTKITPTVQKWLDSFLIPWL